MNTEAPMAPKRVKRSKRTDVHRPAAIVPADYSFVLYYASPTPGEASSMGTAAFEALLESCGLKQLGELERTVAWAPTGSRSQCSVCGSWFRGGAVWRHEPTGEHIYMGLDCSDKYELLFDRSEAELVLGRQRAAVATALLKAEKVAERAAFLAGHPGLEAALATEHRIVRDIAAQLVVRCSLSEKQIALVMKLAAEARAPKATEPESHYVGTVGERPVWDLTVAFVTSFDNDWGSTYVYSMRDAAGNVVVAKVSSGLGLQLPTDEHGFTGWRPVVKGDHVTLKGTIKAHTEYKGTKQTVINRCKILTVTV